MLGWCLVTIYSDMQRLYILYLYPHVKIVASVFFELTKLLICEYPNPGTERMEAKG